MDDSLEQLASQEFELAPEDASVRIGQVLSGRYRIDAVISRGGLGTVYRGEHVHMRKQIAVKVLHPQTKEHPHLVERFEREAIAGAHIHHTNVAAATDFGQLDDGAFFLVTEFVAGRPLHKLIREGRLPQRRAAWISRQIAAGLSAAHAAGIAHRDLKPANVMVVEDDNDLVKLIDFGFARIDFNRLSLPESGSADKPKLPALTTGTMIFGTPAYMAPETVGGMSAVDYRADIYALGVIAFEMLTGERPFDDPQVVRLLRLKHQRPAPSVSERLGANVVEPRLEALVARLLEREPDDRPALAQQVVEELDALLESLPEAVAPARAGTPSEEFELGPTQQLVSPTGIAPPRDEPETQTRVAQARRRSPVAVIVGGVIAVSAAALALVALAGKTSPPGVAPRAETSALASTAWVAAAPDGSVNADDGALPAATDTTASARAKAEVAHSDRSNALRAEMWKAYAQKQWAAGGDALLSLIAEDPSVFEQQDMVEAAASLIVGVDNVDAPLASELIDALGHAPDAGSVDALYQIVWNTGDTRRTGKHALSWLKKPEVIERATPAARVAIELRLAGCAQKRPLFGRAAAEGDERALAELQSLFAMKCGRRKPGPCCFKKDPALTEALSSMSSRLGKK